VLSFSGEAFSLPSQDAVIVIPASGFPLSLWKTSTDAYLSLIAFPYTAGQMFEEKQPKTRVVTALLAQQSRPLPVQIPHLQRQAQIGQGLVTHTMRPVSLQRQQVGPLFQALNLQREADQELDLQRRAAREQAGRLQVPAGAVETALQRQAARSAPVEPLGQAPTSPSQWVQAARLEIQRVQDPTVRDQTRWLSAADRERHVGTLRSVGHGLAQGFKADTSPAVQRYAEYGDGLATLQRQALTSGVVRTVMQQISPAERPMLQRAVDDALQRQQEEEQQAASALHLYSLQRQLTELDQQAEQPIMDRIQARRGSGAPLPVAVQRQLEAGLNHDLSGVRVHTDTEADLLSKKVNAVAFTTGQDIYFQSGKFDPNTQTGIELLAHEATHTVQQSKGQVGKGIDPDAGLEAEARNMGRMIRSRSLSASDRYVGPSASTVNGTGQRHSIQRQFAGPLLVPALSGQDLFLGGQGQQWSDAGSAAQQALHALPARLSQQFKGIPEVLMQGILATLRDTALVLGASTTLGAVIGAFFGGAGAVPGATIGFEIGQAVLTAWGLASVVHTAAQQLNVLIASVKTYLSIVQMAKGNPARVAAAGDALTTGLVIFADGVIMAIAALLIKSGATAFAKSRIGQRVGAAAKNSPTLKWLDERQRLTTTRAVGKSALNRPGNGQTPGLAMAGTSSHAGERATQAPSPARTDRMTSSAPLAPATRVPALVKQVGMAQQLLGWKAVKDFVGKPAGPMTVPPNYLYARIPLSSGKFAEYAYLPRDADGAVPRLKKAPDGTWQPDGLKLDSKGRVVGDYRLAQSSEYNRTNPPPRLAGQSGLTQNHHMTADNVMRGSPVFQELFRRGLSGPDRATNMINLATTELNREVLRDAGHPITDPTHYTQHPKADAKVSDTLRDQVETAQQDGRLPKNLKNATDQQLRDFVDQWDRFLRNRFEQTPDWFPRRPDGSLASLLTPRGQQAPA